MKKYDADLASEADIDLGPMWIKPSQSRVFVGGSETKVEPLVMMVLVTLLRANGQTVRQEQLVKICWGGRIVSDDAFRRIIHKVRLVGKLGEKQLFSIESVAKIGVRLVAEFTPRFRYRGEETSSNTPIVAVLPFENLSNDPDLEFFSDGVSEEILCRLIRGTDLKVVGRTSSFKYRGADKAKAAEELRATHLVDGTVRRSGDTVRLSAHLTESRSGVALWSGRIDGNLNNIFELQDDVAEAIALALQTAFAPPKTEAIDPAIYDLYLRAKAQETDPERLQNNIKTLEIVTQSAPRFADGWGRLAFLHAWMRLRLPYANRQESTERILFALTQCRALDPSNPECQYADFWNAPPFGAFVEQHSIVERLVQDPFCTGDSLAVASIFWISVGRNRDALEAAQRAIDLDPSNWAATITHWVALWGTGRFTEAREAMASHLVDFPHDNMTLGYLIVACGFLGDWDRVDELLSPHRIARYPLREYSGVAAVVAAMRYRSPESARLLFDAIVAHIHSNRGLEPMALVWPPHFELGDDLYDLADRTPIGPTGQRSDMLGAVAYRPIVFFTKAFPELRNNPRFITICARLGLVEFWLETGLWPDCVDEVPYDFRAECRKARSVPKDVFLPNHLSHSGLVSRLSLALQSA